MTENNSSADGSEQKAAKPSASARWKKLIADQEASGLPVSVFCRERGIPQSSLFAWRRRLAAAGTPNTVAKFQPVKIVPETSGQSERSTAGSIELFLRGGRRLLIHKGFDRGLLIELVGTLESLS
jgi:transposase-like protein